MREFLRDHRDNVLWVCFVAFVIITLGDVLVTWIPEQKEPFLKTFNLYFLFVGTWVATLAIFGIFKGNRFLFKYLWTGQKGNTLGMMGLGIVIGFLLNGICILIAYGAGDVKFEILSVSPFQIIAIFIAVFIQSSVEEVICRGFIYERLRRGYKNPWIAIIVNPLFFMLIHLGNTGITPLALYNLFIIGIFFSNVVYYTGSLWMVSAIHAMWNFTQNIIFGLPNSGTEAEYTILGLKESATRITWAYDPTFGIEGTINSAVVLTVCTVLLIFIFKNKGIERGRIQPL